MSDYQVDAPEPKKIPLETRLVNAAEAGDLDTLFELLAQGRGLYKYRYPAYLRHAQGVVADRGSGVLLDTLLRRMVQYDVEFLLRAQLSITQSIRSMDAQLGLQVSNIIKSLPPLRVNASANGTIRTACNGDALKDHSTCVIIKHFAGQRFSETGDDFDPLNGGNSRRQGGNRAQNGKSSLPFGRIFRM